LSGKGVKKYYGDAGQLVPVLFGLTSMLIKLIDIESKKQKSNRSNISRKIVDSYWLDYNKKKIVIPSVQPNQKHPILGLKTVSITLRRDQAAWLRSMAEMTRKTISELGRDAIEFYFSK
jgi:hypothetical protein